MMQERNTAARRAECKPGFEEGAGLRFSPEYSHVAVGGTDPERNLEVSTGMIRWLDQSKGERSHDGESLRSRRPFQGHPSNIHLVVIWRDQDLSRFAAIGRSNQAFIFHDVQQPRRASISDPEAALK